MNAKGCYRFIIRYFFVFFLIAQGIHSSVCYEQIKLKMTTETDTAQSTFILF